MCFIFTANLLAQEVKNYSSVDSIYFYVDSIKILGNEKTENFIILRELNFEIGDTVNYKTLRYNRDRIFSLGIFTKVDLNLEQSIGKNIISILVEESWFIFPIPFLNVREKTLERTSYGVSLKFKNIRGRNETVRATVSLGYDPFYSFEYQNPLLVASLDLNCSLTFAYGVSINKSEILETFYGEQFSFNTFITNTILGKRLNEENNLFLILGYSKINAPSNKLNDYMASRNSVDNRISAGLSYLFDSRNLKQFASNGEYLELTYIFNELLNSDYNFNVINLDFRTYNEIYKTLMIRGRFTTRHTFGKFIPIYDYSTLGFDYYVRGNRYLFSEGNNRVLANLEVAYPILDEWNFGIDLPIIPNSLTRARISIIASLFADIGTIFNNYEKIKLINFSKGYGLGLTILFLPYNSFSLEYAINEIGKGEVLIGTEVSF